MQNKVAPILVAILIGACAAPPAAHATEPFAQVRSWAGQWLHFPRGVRNIGMGATGTADVSGFATGYFNPATLAWSDATTLVGSYDKLYLDMDVSEIALTSPIPFHADSTNSAWKFGGALGYAHLGMAPQEERTIFRPEGTGHTYDPSDWGVSASGAASWTFRDLTIGAGGTTRYLRSSYSSGHADGWVFDVGAIAALPVDLGELRIRPRIGYASLNLDSGIDYDGRTSNVPTDNRIGAGFDLEFANVSFFRRIVPVFAMAIDYDKVDREANTNVDHAAGFEVSALDLVHFRYGSTNDDWDTWGLGAGWDYGHILFRLDYAHAESQDPFFTEFIDDSNRDTFGALVGVRW